MASIRTLIEQAVDRKDPKAAGLVVDRYRATSEITYAEILARVRQYRPEVTEEFWDGLLCEADELDSGARAALALAVRR